MAFQNLPKKVFSGQRRRSRHLSYWLVDPTDLLPFDQSSIVPVRVNTRVIHVAHFHGEFYGFGVQVRGFNAGSFRSWVEANFKLANGAFPTGYAWQSFFGDGDELHGL
jgi:hypothetical protein